MCKITKWATYENVDATRTLKQHCFHSVTKKDRLLGDEYQVARSLCGRIMVGEGDTLAETATIDQIDDEVMNPDTACKLCQKIYNQQTATNEHTNKP